jgi:DNA-binding NarL/FixJ family response regulator
LGPRSRPGALIVDDNRQWQNVIADILSVRYDVLGTIAHGTEVLAAAATLRPDVVTLDISMPGISGLRLLPELRVELPDAAIIVVTTHSSKLYIDEAYRRGADGFVAKNKVVTELIPAIEGAKAPDSARQVRLVSQFGRLT